jgi:hypothetical protein
MVKDEPLDENEVANNLFNDLNAENSKQNTESK